MNEKNIKSTIILANGSFPTHNIPLDALRNASTVVCCDGAIYRFCEWVEEQQTTEKKVVEGKEITIVGDGDSFSAQELSRLQQRLAHYKCTLALHRDPNQENNDLTKSVHYLLRKGIKEFSIVGATGLREDHTLGNISLLVCYAQSASVQMLTDYGYFTPISHTSRFVSFERQQVSIFSLIPTVSISAIGLEYPIEHRCFRQWWEGTLNAALGEEFTIEIEAPLSCDNARSTSPELIVYQTYEPKEL